jgi:hypothetical protein
LISGCGRQLLIAPMGGAFGLNMGTVMTMGQATDVNLKLLAAVLPGVEVAIIDGLNADDLSDHEDLS